MEFVLIMASITLLMMVLAFLTLTLEDREIVQEQLALDGRADLDTTSAPIAHRATTFGPNAQ